VNVPFDGQPAGLKAKRFDMVMSARTDTKARQGEVDFVDCLGFAREVADQVVFMGAGVIVERGHPGEVIGAPREARTKAFLSKVL
jgi:ABC-type histidine transport system ATPase subunit